MNTVLSLLIGGPAILAGIVFEYLVRGFVVGRHCATCWVEDE